MATTQIIAEPAISQVVVTKESAARRELLFRAYTDPGLLAQWLGPRALNLAVDHFDPHDGGSWRYTSSDADGNEYSFHGVFHGDAVPGWHRPDPVKAPVTLGRFVVSLPEGGRS